MKKVIKIILIVIASIVILGALFGTVDYIRAKNGKKPIFTYRNTNINSEGYFIATEYYGLGYAIVICDRCIDDKVIFMPLYLGGYAWFIDDESDIDFEITIKERDKKLDDIIYKELANSYKQAGEDVSAKIYSYGLDEIKITINGKTYLLEDALKQNKITITDIISQLKTEEVLYDGGTNIYRDSNDKKVADGNLTIIKCNAAISNNNFNRDIYIGNKNLIKEENFCK